MKVSVQRHADVAPRGIQARLHGRSLPEVAPERQHADVCTPGPPFLVGSLDRRIAASVVDEDQLPRPARFGESGVYRLDQRRNVVFFVVERDDDGNVGKDLGFGHFGPPGRLRDAGSLPQRSRGDQRRSAANERRRCGPGDQ